MRILWYWPFARPEELPLACSAAREDDFLTVQVVDRAGAPHASPCERVAVVDDLPDVRRELSSSPVWAMSRAGTYVRRARKRRRLTRRITPDVVHLHYLNRFTDWATPRTGRVPLVMSVHDVVPHDSRLPDRAERALLQSTYRRADALVVHHESLRRALLDRFVVDERRVYVIPHQVFDYGTKPTSLPAAPCVLLFGALRHNKGIGVFLDAVARTEGDVRFVVAGRGEPVIEKHLRDVARTDPRIQLELGYVSQQRKTELFQRASLVVLPYVAFASQSGVLHDAYAHGRPVVVTDVGALADTVREDGTGVVVAPADARALADAVARLVSDRPALERYSSNVATVQEARSPRVLGPRLRAVYEELVP